MWKKIGSFLILGVSLICWAAVTFAGEAEVSMSVSQKEILLGDSVILTIAVKGIANPETPQLPDIPGFDVEFRGLRKESFSSMTIIVNGKQVKNERTGGGYNFDFELIPQTTGVLTVPALPIVINGKKYTTQAFQVNVLDQSEKREDIFIDVHVDKTQVYLGEKILVTFKWYFSKDIANYRINIPWLESIKNFLVTDPELDKDRSYQRLIVNGDKQITAIKSREFYKGQEYMVVSFQKVLTPIAAGTYTLEPVFLKCDVITGYKRSRRGSLFDSFFDSDFEDFFGFGRDAVTEPFATRSNEITLTVSEVPKQGKPVEYNGAVGRFTFDVSVKPRFLKVGEPITLTMKVAGSGNIEQLQLPHIPDIESFKSYEPESKVDITHESGQVKGEKIFEKVLIPRAPGDYEIPKITFAFFNPETGRYQIERRGPFGIKVIPAEKEEEVKVIAITPEGDEKVQKRKIKLLKKDIRYIKTNIGEIISRGKPAYENAAVWILAFLTPVLLLVGIFISSRRRERLNTDVAFARSRAALKNSKEYFNRAEKAAEKKQTREFYDLLMKGVNSYLADKLNRQLGSIDAAVLNELQGLKKEEREDFKIFYERANEALFSSLPVEPEKLKRDLRAAKGLVARLERILR